MTERRLFVFGLGYSAGGFARLVKDRAGIAGTVRTAERAAALSAEGLTTHIFDGIAPGAGVAGALRDVTHILVSIPPGETGDPVLARHGADIAAAPKLRWIGYLSTVGVYGNYGGAWVTERTTPHPPEGRQSARLQTEKAWTKLAADRGIPAAILRIAGIYGPGRNAFVQLAEGTAHRVVKPGQVFNRIHVADITRTIAAALEREAGGIFNLSDDEPAPGQDVIAHAAGLMGVAPPPEVPFDQAELSPMARSFYEGNRRVANRRIKADFGVVLRYPTYREGLAALWNEDTWRG